MANSEAPRALRHLWASPALFVLAAFVAFNVVGSGDAGWTLMAGGLSGPAVALVWQALRRERPEAAFVVIPLALLALMTVLFGINEGFPWS
ncbi:hypothetical protein ACFVZC_16925 [Streptomyces marokkonensis]|uniref:Uncharacterized protein n=1 Tax=Streptomyces marokkonensis TaxID=324855 RepID=A0ABW6Q793_9ACTN|nr:hypothetical protein [Streptomyces marokkonensis]